MIVLGAAEDDGAATDETARALQDLWIKSQEEQAAISTSGQYILAENSGHCIPCDQPELVIDSIKSLVESARE